MAFQIPSELRLSRLRFPFAVRVEAVRGVARLRDANARREVRPGDPFVVPAFAHFDCDLQAGPGRPVELTLTAVPDQACPRMLLAGGQEKYWSRALAHAIFLQPRLAWNATLAAERWHVAPRLVRARLFAEGEALHALLREQRVAHALYALAVPGLPPDTATPAGLGRLAQAAGLRDAATLANACANLHGMHPACLLAAPGAPAAARTLPGWHPAAA
ncbi:AraC family transcriptional regulator [Cupriavidus sp. USMAA2-4]|uniref:AraC family transcriptional regulator n=1 Tax=Cupriavidus malaysiensis TaxID=367825 RepID=A0A1D9ICC8_9BURK|nr:MULTISPECIES: AraC family transcriptional regulator [Cupriavidus]AOY96664.1 AraC family transcriptional regulator [Cupriavidus sp. USMAA2-4]AOZ09698.1 AraC family transcriptional regulator [Cupriavidus malaysiensis]